MSTRDRVVERVVDHLLATSVGHPLRVGVDGVCGSGKSTLARDLARAIEGRGRSAVHLDSDGFHHRAEIRHRDRADPARGYYADAYDFAGLTEHVLIPLGPGGSGRYATRIHDLATDSVVQDAWVRAVDDAVIIFDCTFLQRGDLRAQWDEVIYLEVSRDVALERGAARDAAALGGLDLARKAYEARYMAACDRYLQQERPASRASIVINMDDPLEPRVLRGLPRS